MPSGIKGFRWIETGRRVWGLESKPRYFHGFVSEYIGREPPCNWHTTYNAGQQHIEGEAQSTQNAKEIVEAIVLDCPARRRVIHRLTGLNFCDLYCGCGENNQLWWTPTGGASNVPDWALWMNGCDSDSIWNWLVENGKVSHAS